LTYPYLSIKAQTKKGDKIKSTKPKARQINPVWNEEKFSFKDFYFPIVCSCFSQSKEKAAKQADKKDKKETEKDKEKDKEKSELIGYFMIEKEHIPKVGQLVQRWYFLETQDTMEGAITKARILVEMLLFPDS